MSRLRNPFVLAGLALPLLPVLFIVVAVLTLLAVSEFESAAKGCGQGKTVDPFAKIDYQAPEGPNVPGPGEPPENYIDAYFAAAEQPDAQLGMELGPFVLMGIHKVESSFGRSNAAGVKSGINFANCCKGPFQFYDTSKWSTWMAKSPVSGQPFGRDADGDGKAVIYDNYDSMFAAAALLYASGAPGDWKKALLSYNHDVSYGEQVLGFARYFKQHVKRRSGVQAVVDMQPATVSASTPEPAGTQGPGNCPAGSGDPSSSTQLVSASDGGPYSPPLPDRSYDITTKFWEDRGSYNHQGTDLAAPEGTPFSAMGAGKVTIAGPYDPDGYGTYICIEHTQQLKSCYGHPSRVDVKVGETVKRGQQIGLVGAEGDSTGPHLHFEVWLDGSVVCPANYVGKDRETWCEANAPGYDSPPPASNGSEPKSL